MCGRMLRRSLIQQEQDSAPPLIFIPNAEEVILGSAGGGIDFRKGD